MFFTFGWLRYRRMYAYSWAYLLISTPTLFLVGSFVVADACTVEVSGAWATTGRFLVLLALGYLLPALFANRLYFQFFMKSIADARMRESHGDAPVKSVRMRTSTAGYLDPVVTTIVGILLVAIVPGLPLHSHSGPRVMISGLTIKASNYKTEVGEFLRRTSACPWRLRKCTDGNERV